MKEYEVCKISLESFEKIKHFCQLVTNFTSNIYLKSERYVIDAKSIMGVMILDFSTGTDAIITVNGADEEVALEEIYKFLSA